MQGSADRLVRGLCPSGPLVGPGPVLDFSFFRPGPNRWLSVRGSLAKFVGWPSRMCYLCESVSENKY